MSMKRILFILLFLPCVTFSQSLYTVNNDINRFEISYSTAVPDSVKNIVSAATRYWSKYLFTEIKIHISVEWTVLGSNVQSNCQPARYFKNFKNAPFRNVFYPVALAEKIASSDLNLPTDADMKLKINKGIAWNCNLSNHPTADQSDLFTVLIHELAHGVGFNSYFAVDESVGYLIGSSSTPYDIFVVDSLSRKLTDTSFYKLNSTGLKAALTSQKLFFNGQFSIAINNGERISLYAPSQFNDGSTVTHFDEDKYPKGTINSLMTPMFTKGEEIREAGPAALSVIADLGWNDFMFSAERVSDVEEVSFETNIRIYAADFIDSTTILLHYSLDNFAHEQTIKAISIDSVGYFVAEIPSLPFERKVSYYVTAKDTSSRKLEVGDPVNYPSNFYSFTIGKDTIKPVISHEPISSITEDMDTIQFSATITDNLGVDSAWVEYSLKSDASKPSRIVMKKSGTSLFTVQLGISLKEGQFLQYRIVAVDKSNNSNKAYTQSLESNGFYQYTVGPKSNPFVSLDENFDDITTATSLFTTSGFQIVKNPGFSSSSLNSAHPYANSSIDGEYLNITATLNNPVILRSSEAYMDFDEIVLLEPGESGTVWGDYEYWDYVIVEGSKNRIDWYPFEWKGYKTEMYDEWLTKYYSEIEKGENGKESSVAVATEDLYRHHTVNLLGNKYLRKGDKVYIRFRMYTDAFENGWGWSIDNLKIQTTPVSVEETCEETGMTYSFSNGIFRLYPGSKDVKYVVFKNILGQEISTYNVGRNTPSVEITPKINTGIYIACVVCESGEIIPIKILSK